MAMEQFLGLTKNPLLANTFQSFLNPTPYFLILIFLFLVVFIYGINSGRGRMILMLISLYMTIVLAGLFPYKQYLAENVKIGEPYFIELGLFLVSFFVVLALLLNSPLRTVAVKSRGHIFQVLILSILILGIFVSHLTVLLPVDILSKLSHPIFSFFKTETAQFWWALAGVAMLAAMRRRGE